MCGITGLAYSDKSNSIQLSDLKRMTDSIIHRGPDDDGHFIKNNVGLGFRRLSIIDLKSGHQPMSDISNNFTLVFNGEIYNYKEKRNLLRSKGYMFRTDSDTEVLLNLYIEFGADCLQHLRGMFSFAIYDNEKNILFCARDRFGIKPFYYSYNRNQFIFGSEIKSILASDSLKTTLSYPAIDSFFAYGYITSDYSIYNEINKLQPGTYLELDLNKWKITKTKYWDVEYSVDYTKSENEWIELLEAKFKETVKLHMVSDVPIGSFLSGGIDSSAVTAFMAQSSEYKINTFSIGFDKEDFNELPFSHEVVERYKTLHFEEIVKPDSISIIPKIIEGFDEPFADSSAIPTYLVSKFASEKVKVILSGDGGDELFAGYNMYNKMMAAKKYNLPFPSFNKMFWLSINQFLPVLSRFSRKAYFLSKNPDFIAAYTGCFTQFERQKLLKKDISEKIENNYIEEFSEAILSKYLKNDFLLAAQALNIKVILVDDFLTKVDRMSMSNSLEVRVPFLDHEFAELVFQIPSNLKMKGKIKKFILKQMLKKHLPKNVISHKKQGFAVPLKYWFKDTLTNYIEDTLGNKSSQIYNYLDYNIAHKVIQNHSKNSYDLSAHIWSLIIFNEWLNANKKYIN